MAIEQNPEPVPSIDDLQRQNHDLLEWIAQLEASLGECQQALQMQMERSQAQDQLLAQRGQDLVETQDQMTRLFQELESSHQTNQRQQVLVETLTQQLAASQTQIAQLERDCTLAQQRYDEQAQHLAQAESISHDLRARLYRQQRYTLQFKAALEKCLERSHRHDHTNPETSTLQGLVSKENLIETMLDDLAEPSQSGYPKAKPVQPWTAELDASELSTDVFPESDPATLVLADSNSEIFSLTTVQSTELTESTEPTELVADLPIAVPELTPTCTVEPLEVEEVEPLTVDPSEPVAQTEFPFGNTTNDPWSLLDANTLEWTTTTADVGPEVSDDIKKLLDEMLQSASELLGPELPELATPDFTQGLAGMAAEPPSPVAASVSPLPIELPPATHQASQPTQPHHRNDSLVVSQSLDEQQSHELQILIPDTIAATTVSASPSSPSSPPISATAFQPTDDPTAQGIQLPTVSVSVAAADRSPRKTSVGVPPFPVMPSPEVQMQPSTAAIAKPTESLPPTQSTSGFNQPSVLSILSNVSSPSHQEAVNATADQPLPLPDRSPLPEPTSQPTPSKVTPSSHSWPELLTLKTQLLANTSFGNTFSPELATAAPSRTDTSTSPNSDPQFIEAATPPSEGKLNSPSPLLYPSRAGKKIQSLAAIDLPTFPRKS